VVRSAVDLVRGGVAVQEWLAWSSPGLGSSKIARSRSERAPFYPCGREAQGGKRRWAAGHRNLELQSFPQVKASLAAGVEVEIVGQEGLTVSSPRWSQLEPGLVERGTLRLKRLHRAAVIEVIPWNGSSESDPEVSGTPKIPRDPLKLAHYYQSLVDSGQLENRAALARFLGVSRARVTQVLKRLNEVPTSNEFV
jgi:hypothetical protein